MTATSDRGELTPLTRWRLQAARDWLARFVADSRGTADAHYLVLLAAAERLLAPPASDDEIAGEYRSDGTLAKPFHFGAPYICGYRAAERRLLLPADDGNVRDETETKRC